MYIQIHMSHQNDIYGQSTGDNNANFWTKSSDLFFSIKIFQEIIFYSLFLFFVNILQIKPKF